MDCTRQQQLDTNKEYESEGHKGDVIQTHRNLSRNATPKNCFKKDADFPYIRGVGWLVGQPTYAKFHMFFAFTF